MQINFYLFISTLVIPFINAIKFGEFFSDRRAGDQFDFFGPSKYGFMCADRIYVKHEIYAALHQACLIWYTAREKTIFGELIHETRRSKIRDADFSNYQSYNKILKPPYILYPILRNSLIFDESKNMAPGSDRVVMDKNCELVTILTKRTISSPRRNALEIDFPESSRARESDAPTVRSCDILNRPLWSPTQD